MCDPLGDAFSFVKDSVGEVFKHPGEALGAAFGVPGYDPFFGGLFNSDHSLLSPTGNFTSSAWNDMYNANPQDSGALGLFHGINDVADKVAPAIAGAGIGGALGGVGAAGDTGAGIGADAFTSGLGEAGAGASSLGGLEGGLGGASLFGPAAGTGTALGAAAQGLGAGGLGIADASALGGLASSGGTYLGGLGGSTSSGTGLGSLTNGGAAVPQTPVSTGAGSTSLEGNQGFVPSGGGNPEAAGITGQAPAPSGGNLSTMFGPNSTAGASPTGMGISQSGDATTAGISPFGANLGVAPTATSGGAFDYLKTPTGIQDLFKLGQQGLGAYQQYQKGQAANNYANSISGLFGPNSPYAQQMQQTLGRTDAAAGRNSQYGTRSVQLAAALAKAQADALGGNNYANARQDQSIPGMLTGVTGLFANTQAGKNLGTAAFNGLSQLFGS